MVFKSNDSEANINWSDLKSASTKNNKSSAESVKGDDSVHTLEQKLKGLLNEKEHTARSWLTITFLIGLFFLILLSAIYVITYNNNLFDIMIAAKSQNIDLSKHNLEFMSFNELFSLIFNSFGTSLGFIIGYYFKEKISK
ncbi:hypothetical protein [Photobacterium leiognathi]|uniref:hypothetical protein n=1 Tax=Photobacterium leiognathi TaxID=553611 RepID=UPI00298108A6|nr:hypothetical protein [Photobacterium leiognathi]